MPENAENDRPEVRPSAAAGTEGSDERFRDLDVWPVARTVQELVDSNRRALEVVHAALPQLTAAAEAIGSRLAIGGRLIYAGAGTSGRLAMQDAAELPPTFGFNRAVVLLAGGAGAGTHALEGAEDDAEAAAQAIAKADVGTKDVLIGIAASGRTPYTVAALVHAGERGALTVGIANNTDTPLLAAAAYPVCLETGPEVLSGSTRLGAGTAQKVALNTLSTSALVKLGGAYRNLMVGMTQSNSKLRRRAVAIVAQATGVGEARSREALEASGGSIRAAIICLRTGVSREEALELLAAHQDRVRDALVAAGDNGE